MAAQFAQEETRACEIAVNDEGVHFGSVECGQRPLWLGMNGDSDLKAAQDALENADFRPIA